MRFTLEDVVNFCEKYRGKHGFEGFSYEQIASHIIQKADENLLFIFKDKDGICGVCTISEYPSRIYIHHIVGIRTGFVSMVKEVSHRYGERDIIGYRKSKQKLVTFNKRLLWVIARQALEAKPANS